MTDLSRAQRALVRAGRVYSADALVHASDPQDPATSLARLFDAVERAILPTEITCDLGSNGRIIIEAADQSIRCFQGLPEGLSRRVDPILARPLTRADAEEVCAALKRWFFQTRQLTISARPICADGPAAGAGLALAHLRRTVDLDHAASIGPEASTPFESLQLEISNDATMKLDLNAGDPSFPTSTDDPGKYLLKLANGVIDRLLHDESPLKDAISTEACITFGSAGIGAPVTKIGIKLGIAEIDYSDT